jgi:hypothetical protein
VRYQTKQAIISLLVSEDTVEVIRVATHPARLPDPGLENRSGLAVQSDNTSI